MLVLVEVGASSSFFHAPTSVPEFQAHVGQPYTTDAVYPNFPVLTSNGPAPIRMSCSTSTGAGLSTPSLVESPLAGRERGDPPDGSAARATASGNQRVKCVQETAADVQEATSAAKAGNQVRPPAKEDAAGQASDEIAWEEAVAHAASRLDPRHSRPVAGRSRTALAGAAFSEMRPSSIMRERKVERAS